MRGPRQRRFTYANVMSTIAVFLALAGGATALAVTLSKSSVKSRHIAKGAVRTSDIGRNAATGAKVREGSLREVPRARRARTAQRAATATSADLLDGLDSLDLPQARNVSDASFRATEPLELEVEGFGTYRIECDAHNGLSLTDDEPVFAEETALPSSALQTGLLATAAGPVGDAPSTVQIRGGKPASGFSAFQDERLHVVLSESDPATQRAIIVVLGGFDNEATLGCSGHIQALVYR